VPAAQADRVAAQLYPPAFQPSAERRPRTRFAWAGGGEEAKGVPENYNESQRICEIKVNQGKSN